VKLLVGAFRWCDIDLAGFFGPGGADKVRDGWYPLLDPSNSAKEVRRHIADAMYVHLHVYFSLASLMLLIWQETSKTATVSALACHSCLQMVL